MNRDWPGYNRARQLRHWQTTEFVAAAVEENDVFEALILVGSFAKDCADAASDLDLMVPVESGRFDEAWTTRHLLQPPGALYAWDVQPPSETHWAARKFITNDIVKVEIGITDPTVSGARLADPFVVLAGDPRAAERYRHVPPPTDADLQQAADRLREVDLVPVVEGYYDDLMRALRAKWDSC